MVEVFVIIIKLFATVFLGTLLISGLLKADPRRHNPKYPPLAEYGAGFIASGLAFAGFYWLWLA